MLLVLCCQDLDVFSLPPSSFDTWFAFVFPTLPPFSICPGVSQALKLLSWDLVTLGKLTELHKIQEARSILPLCSQVLVASLAQAGQKILAESDCFELHLFLFNVIRCFLTCVINDILTL